MDNDFHQNNFVFLPVHHLCSQSERRIVIYYSKKLKSAIIVLNKWTCTFSYLPVHVDFACTIKRILNLGNCQIREKRNNLHAAIKFINAAVHSVKI